MAKPEKKPAVVEGDGTQVPVKLAPPLACGNASRNRGVRKPEPGAKVAIGKLFIGSSGSRSPGCSRSVMRPMRTMIGNSTLHVPPGPSS